MAYVVASIDNPLGWRPWISRLGGLGQADYVPSATTPGGAAQRSVLARVGLGRLGQYRPIVTSPAAAWPGIGQWYNPVDRSLGVPNWAWWGAAALGILLLWGGPRRLVGRSWQRVRSRERKQARIAELQRQVERGR